MRSVTYSMGISLDGYIVGPDGDITAPPPGTVVSRPQPGVLNTLTSLYEYESNGQMNQNQMIVNLNSRINPKITLFTFYVLNSAKSDTDGAGSFPANQYDTGSEYGRSSIDVRNRFVFGGSLVAPYGLRFSPFVVASSGSPFNITTGQDLNGDLQFTDRPAFATAATLHPIATPFGVFDTNPAAGAAIIPRNYGNGPGQFTVNLRVGRTWGFGERTTSAASPAGGGGDGGGMRGGGGHGPGGPGGGGPGGGGPGGMRMGGGGGGRGGFEGGSSGKKYTVNLSVSGRNIFNHVNPGTPIGDLSSPNFGVSNSIASGGFGGPGGGGGGSANNRRIDLQLRFSF